MLSRDEYVEQAYFYRILVERLDQQIPLQDLLAQTKHELLASTKLPMAIDLLLAELKHHGRMSAGMKMLSHYFMPFQTFLVSQAESDRGRFDYKTALRILASEAEYRTKDNFNPQGLFFYQFEAVSRNRLNYDRGLTAMAGDDYYAEDWSEWLLMVRHQLGLVDLAEMIYARSEHLVEKQSKYGEFVPKVPVLFGNPEGKIAYANRQKDSLFLFAAMQRHLGYPKVPKLEPVDPLPTLVPQLQRRMERLEARLRLMEEEQNSGSIDITKFYDGKLPPGFQP